MGQTIVGTALFGTTQLEVEDERERANAETQLTLRTAIAHASLSRL